MKKLVILSAAFVLGGCSFAARSPDMYRDDTQKALATKEQDIRACYDGVLKTTPGAAGKVTVKFDVETENGKFVNVHADKGGTTAPDAVAECVTKSLEGLSIAPPDKRKGEATFVYEFAAPTGGAPAAAPAASPVL